ncbi:MAG TPA: IS200/IS605 family transposase [Parafilimonas sp.]|nr:IS200/IS605 family transposase [Parafilimonas sp.]
MHTYSQINIHSIFAVKYRENVITTHFRDNLHKYMSGILRNDGSYPLAVGGWEDHVHVFFEMQPTMSVSKQMQMLKASSSKWINDNKFVKGRFLWQEGYAAVSVARSDRDRVIKYIMNQEEHHGSKRFREEYFELLNEFQIEFDPQYIFEFYE